MDKDALFGELKRRRPFDRMEEQHLRWMVDNIQAVTYPAGTAILTPGKSCDALYFIHSGSVQLEAMGNAGEEQKVLAELVEGESFPVEALHEHRPVFSTFRAKSETVCSRLTSEQFDELKQKSKVFSDFCQYRSASFLEQSRRVYRLHFSHQSEENQRLSVPLSLLMHPDPLVSLPGQTLREVLRQMYELHAPVVVIVDEASRPTGLFTMVDLLRTVVSPGNAIEGPVGSAMTPIAKTLPANALGYEAALVMAEGGTQHVVLVNGEKLAGIVHERDLFNLQRTSLSQISAQISSAKSVKDLKRCREDIELVAENMLIQGVTADQITQIISSLNDQVVCRTIDLELAGEDLGGIKVCWISLGSEGRFEQTFSTDQDNGIIFEAPEGMDVETARQRLLPIAQRFNKSLDAVGFPLCKGNVMAGNPKCCLSYAEWQRRFTQWMQTPTPDALLNATIFFDFRHLAGDVELADRLRLWLSTATREQNLFFKLLAENALQRTPPIGFFRDFVVDDDKDHPDTIDIKLNGVSMFVDAARIYALASGVTRSNTKHRLITVGELRKWPQSEVNAWADAFSFLQSLRVRHQFELKRNGGESHNRLNPYELNNLDRKFFLESLRQAGKLQRQLGGDFGNGGM